MDTNTMVGSEKQVSWAEAIRRGAMETIEMRLAGMVDRIENHGDFGPRGPAMLKAHRIVAEAMLAQAGTQTSAKWWIENERTALFALFHAAVPFWADRKTEVLSQETGFEPTKDGLKLVFHMVTT